MEKLSRCEEGLPEASLRPRRLKRLQLLGRKCRFLNLCFSRAFGIVYNVFHISLQVLSRNNLTTLSKILKISSHLGFWESYSLSTGEFQAVEPVEAVLDDDYAFNNGQSDTLVEENANREGKLPPSIENAFVLYEAGTDEENGMDFQPTVTDRGLCLAANVESMGKLLKEGHPYREVFAEAFKKEIKELPVANNNGTGDLYSLRFYAVNHGALNNLQDERKTFFDVALNWHKDAFNVRNNKITVRTGYHTIVKVLIPQVTSISDDVRDMDEGSRKCRLTSESNGMEILSEYTKAGCRYECALRHSAQECRCMPWNYPGPVGNITKTCDLHSTPCFERAMARQNKIKCDCPVDCSSLRLGLSEPAFILSDYIHSL